MSNGMSMRKKRMNGLFRQRGYSSFALYSVAALLLMLLQNAPHLFPEIWYARPIPLIPFVVCVAVFEGAKAGALIGTVAGLLWGLYSLRLFGFDALILMMIGLAAGLLVEWLLRANFFTSMLLCGCAILLQAIVDWLCTYVIFERENMFPILLLAYLPNCLYTLVLSPLIYWCVLQMARLIRRSKNR